MLKSSEESTLGGQAHIHARLGRSWRKGALTTPNKPSSECKAWRHLVRNTWWPRFHGGGLAGRGVGHATASKALRLLVPGVRGNKKAKKYLRKQQKHTTIHALLN
jgi:hypothetical protein